MILRALFVASVVSIGASVPGLAQTAGSLPPSWLPQNGGAGIRTGHITATGATVPIVGIPYSAGNTAQDLAIQKQNNVIDNSICKGC